MLRSARFLGRVRCRGHSTSVSDLHLVPSRALLPLYLGLFRARSFKFQAFTIFLRPPCVGFIISIKTLPGRASQGGNPLPVVQSYTSAVAPPGGAASTTSKVVGTLGSLYQFHHTASYVRELTWANQVISLFLDGELESSDDFLRGVLFIKFL